MNSYTSAIFNNGVTFPTLFFVSKVCHMHSHAKPIIQMMYYVGMAFCTSLLSFNKIRGVNVRPNPRTRYEPDMSFCGLGLCLNGFGS